jgi:predicted metal-dependent hydrolase|tara:strand:+ start:450 stop:773 length:324 start_codon:yes stop_codon:yes gene_type:complete
MKQKIRRYTKRIALYEGVPDISVWFMKEFGTKPLPKDWLCCYIYDTKDDFSYLIFNSLISEETNQLIWDTILHEIGHIREWNHTKDFHKHLKKLKRKYPLKDFIKFK